MNSAHWQFDWFDHGVANAPQDLLRTWSAAAEDHGNIWQVPELVDSWERTVANATGRTAHLLVARNGFGQALIYPLYAHQGTIRHLPCVVVEPLGAELQFDYQDPLEIGKPLDQMQRGLFWKQLHAVLRKKFGLSYDFRAYRLLSANFDGSNSALQTSTAPFIDLTGIDSLEGFLSTRGKKLREHVSRGLRHLLGIGCNSLIRIRTEQIHDHIRPFCEMHQQRWLGDERSVSSSDQHIRDCWALLAENAAKLNKLHFSALIANREIWSYHLGFEHRGVLLWYKPAYNVGYERYSPGSLHLALLINDCLDRRIRHIDLGCGDEPYKARWADQQLPLYSLCLQSGVCALDTRLRRAAGSLRKAHPQLYARAKRLVMG
jgi:CelD/BcsL family acetyltransferase involved in cellulose biosynthesis